MRSSNKRFLTPRYLQYIGQRPKSTHFWNDDTDADSEPIKKTEVAGVLDQTNHATEIIIYFGDTCPCICNKEMETFLRESLLLYFDVHKVDRWTNYCFLKAGSGLKKDYENDENREKEEEIDKRLAERESELLRSQDDAYEEEFNRK
mmetsp:Transcript_20816/g.28645  ORF Transcript_20816/g.28645 Transcript_20816/m.28645 type:complete len:147 (+) Transcript_20816:322-762(+)|eukprot:CAMPEP_0170063328 /NCGR_PEP_ID=MMETSP0019_2-20121128/4237_1 /TAXON_ID=98059 /ORGANISM="Dinobryon sp., Strain UTEXLB2267" /LENGTH=146 /DNA_ID=CAMNT_0010269731 /DNA_START=350 /DNA_END=790 /DNA_ORIENTATION=+